MSNNRHAHCMAHAKAACLPSLATCTSDHSSVCLHTLVLTCTKRIQPPPAWLLQADDSHLHCFVVYACLLQGGGKQAAPKQSQAGAKQVPPAASSDKQAATSASAQAQAPAQGMPAGPKAKPAKQASRVQQQLKGAADSQAMSLPSDVFAHLPRYNVSYW